MCILYTYLYKGILKGKMNDCYKEAANTDGFSDSLNEFDNFKKQFENMGNISFKYKVSRENSIADLTNS